MKSLIVRTSICRRTLLICVPIFVATGCLLVRGDETPAAGATHANTPCREIAIPEDVCGAKLLKASVSADGGCIVVAGMSEVSFSGFDPGLRLYSPEGATQMIGFYKALQGKMLISTFPPQGDGWRQLPALPTLGYVLSMAVSAQVSPSVASPATGRRIAYVVRESQATVPESLDGFSDDEMVAHFAQVHQTIQKLPVRESLYVIGTNDKTPRRLCVLRENVPSGVLISRDDLSLTSVCWSVHEDSVLCSDGEAVYKVSLSGERTSLYEFVETQCIGQLHASDGNVSFVEQTFTGLPSRNTLVPNLVTVSFDGVVLSRRQLPAFDPDTLETCRALAPTPQSPRAGNKKFAVAPERYNLAILGEGKYATFDKELHLTEDDKPATYTLRVRSLKAPDDVLSEQQFSFGRLPLYYSLAAFVAGEEAVLLIEKVNPDGSYAREELPVVKAEEQGIALCRLLLLPLK